MIRVDERLCGNDIPTVSSHCALREIILFCQIEVLGES